MGTPFVVALISGSIALLGVGMRFLKKEWAERISWVFLLVGFLGLIWGLYRAANVQVPMHPSTVRQTKFEPVSPSLPRLARPAAALPPACPPGTAICAQGGGNNLFEDNTMEGFTHCLVLKNEHNDTANGNKCIPPANASSQ